MSAMGTQRGRIRDWLASAPATPAAPTPPPDSDLDPDAESVLSNGLHRWRVFTRRGDDLVAGEDGSSGSSGSSDSSPFRSPVFQQSVTLTAKMWPEESGGSEGALGGAAGGAGGSAGGWSSWRVSGEHLPLVVGGVAGGALIVMLLVAAAVWRLCVLRRDKQYRVRMGECSPDTCSVQPVMPSESVVFASPVSGRWAYESRLLGSDGSPRGSSTPPLRSAGGLVCTPPPPPQAWVYGDTIITDPLAGRVPCSPPVHRSVSLQLAEQSPVSRNRGHNGGVGGGAGGGRLVSVVSGSCSAVCGPTVFLPPPPPEFRLPDICEFNPGATSSPCRSPGGGTPGVQYASSSVLDDSGSLEDGEALEALRTRSLPSSVRNRSRPLASEEDLDQLYAKVNFSKKRKNRMRHDEAAIIAISKSRSQFLDKVAADPDTDQLEEAVIVYNERTAL